MCRRLVGSDLPSWHRSWASAAGWLSSDGPLGTNASVIVERNGIVVLGPVRIIGVKECSPPPESSVTKSISVFWQNRGANINKYDCFSGGGRCVQVFCGLTWGRRLKRIARFTFWGEASEYLKSRVG